MEADAYRIPPLPRCDERTDQDRQRSLDRHNPALYPVPPGWKVTIDPRETRLGPGEEHLVTVDITAPDGFAGLQTFNVNTFSNATLMGGVTLHTEG